MHRCIDPGFWVNTRIHIHTYVNFVSFVDVKSYCPLGLVPAIHGREDDAILYWLPARVEVGVRVECPEEPLVSLLDLNQKWGLIIEDKDRHKESQEQHGYNALHLLYLSKRKLGVQI